MNFAALAFLATAFAITPDNVYIQGLIYGGSGCRQGTVSSFVSADFTTFTLLFDEFIASSGPGIPITESRKNCQINVDLHYPQGWSYSIVEVDYRGFVNVPSGITATQSATYYFSGNSKQCTAYSNFKGPYAGDYLATDILTTSAIVWSPCGANVAANINAKVSLVGDLKKPGVITTDSIDTKVSQIYGLKWQRC